MSCTGKLEYRCMVGMRLYEEDEKGRKVYDARCVKCGHQQDTNGQKVQCGLELVRPWSKVTRADARGCNSIGNNQLQTQYWDIELECGHSTERRMRFPKQGPSQYRRGFAALHHPRLRSEALPAPKKCRCPVCPKVLK